MSGQETGRRNMRTTNGDTIVHEQGAIDMPVVTVANSVLAGILATAQRLGHATAVACGDDALSYAQLIASARHNAGRLRKAGVKQGDLVLCGLSTGVELAVAWVATMLANAVLVPIDPQWPTARLAAVLQTARAPLAILASGAEWPSVLSEHGVRGLEIDTVSTGDAGPDVTALVGGSDLLYGFFTSGSTGTPKCALNHHAGVANRFSYMTRRFGEGHRVYQNSAPLFDSSIWQLLWPLTSGGVCILPDNRGHWSPEAVAHIIEHASISMTDFVPTLFKALVRSMEQGTIDRRKLQSLRYVLIGGEAIDPVSVHAFRRMLPDVRIINTYGYTEASIGMVFHEVRDEDGDAIPLGLPIDHTFVRIAGDDLSRLPDGEIGEIVAGGICVGAGYLNAAELTAKAFVRNPFADVPGEWVYRSGDLGRVRDDGLLEFLGRIDDQVKVRGVRIELGEVSTAVHQAFPQIEDACPVLVVSDSGEQSLAVAYAARQALSPRLLKQRLCEVLPASHVPQYFVHLSHMPTGSNGKTQRKEVARRVSEALQRSAHSDEPARSPLDLIIQSYREVLGIRDIDRHSHFFEYGGDSLGAVHLSLALQDRLGSAVTAGQVYRYPTPESLHEALAGSSPGEAPALRLPDIRFGNAGEPSFRSESVLLTGATGFVGIHLLERLLNRADVHVVALVRQKGSDTPYARLEDAFHKAFPHRVLDRSRVSVLGGDLSRPSLGLSESAWAQAAATIDEVIHCGADVNFLGSPSSLFDANVAGTAELIRLCNEGRAKRFHQISTMAVMRIQPGVEGQPCASGYEYTKHLADQLVHHAREQGLKARTYRLDDVLPALGSGYPNQRSLIHLFLKACLRHGVVVTGSGTVGLLPVDVLAEWMCSFVGRADSFSSLPYSVDVSAVSHVGLDEIVRFVAGKLGKDMRVVDYAAFMSCLEYDDDRDATFLRSMLVDAGDAKGLFARHPSVATSESSALGTAEWKTRFSIELEHFAPFVDYMGQIVRASPHQPVLA